MKLTGFPNKRDYDFWSWKKAPSWVGAKLKPVNIHTVINSREPMDYGKAKAANTFELLAAVVRREGLRNALSLCSESCIADRRRSERMLKIQNRLNKQS